MIVKTMRKLMDKHGGLREAVENYEGKIIAAALAAHKGRITHAARELGVSHQGLAFILNGRHKQLQRSPIKRRLRSIITKPAATGRRVKLLNRKPREARETQKHI